MFFTKYEDAQRAVNIITENQAGATFQETVFYNAAEVEAKGVELEFQALLTDSFRIRAQASYLDAEYKEFVINQPQVMDPVTGATIQEFVGDFSGLPVPRSPEFMGSMQALYTWTLGSGAALEFGAEYYHEDENLFYISAAGRQYDAYLDEKNLLNASVRTPAPTAPGSCAVTVATTGRAISHRLAVGRHAVDAHAMGRAGQLRHRGPGSASAAAARPPTRSRRRRPAQRRLFFGGSSDHRERLRQPVQALGPIAADQVAAFEVVGRDRVPEVQELEVDDRVLLELEVLEPAERGGRNSAAR